MRRRRRTLSPDDLELWAKVRATAVPLHAEKPEPLPKPPPAVAEPAPPTLRAPLALPARMAPDHSFAKRRGSVSLDLRPDPLAAPTVMDRKTHLRMKRGKLDPEARVDLHGMTQAEAHAELTAFLLGSHALGRRLVLVITGKGAAERPRDGQRGILRHQVPHWLQLAPLRQIVLQVTEAHLSHGGGGAIYIYLRRSR